MDELNEHIRGIAFVDEDVKEEGVPLPMPIPDSKPIDEKHIYGWDDCPMVTDELEPHLKLEALKLAYDTAHKIGGFSQMSTYMAHDSKALLEDDIRDVFKLADMNYQYIKGRS